MSIVVDESWMKLPVSELQSAGVVAVSMYVSQDDTGKNMNPEIVKEYAAAGIKTIANFEYLSTDAQGGFAAGQANAKLALQQATACGMPFWAPIIFSVDENIQGADAVMYFNGIRTVLPVNRIGVYGDYGVVSALLDLGVATYGWQTVAWSNGQIDQDQIQLYQTGLMIDGVDLDLIEGDLMPIAWVPGEPNPTVWSEIPVAIVCPEMLINAEGVYVELMQSLLNVHGGTEKLTVDGDFGPDTQTRLEEYQTNNSLTSDGICGPLTWTSLLS